MIVYGCCAGPSNTYDEVARPALERLVKKGDVIVRETGDDGICAAYNRILSVARDLNDCEAVVLLHDDVELRDPMTRERIRSYVAEPGVGVVGVAGGRGLTDGTWWGARHRAGQVDDHYGQQVFGPLSSDVDSVDGCLMILAPAAFLELDFDTVNLPAFHGYDVDFSLRARSKGLRVIVRPLDLWHRSKEGYGDESAFTEAVHVVERLWPGWIRKATVGDKTRAVAGRARHRVAVKLKDVRRGRQG